MITTRFGGRSSGRAAGHGATGQSGINLGRAHATCWAAWSLRTSTSRSYLRRVLVSTEYPRRGRGVAVTRLSTEYPRSEIRRTAADRPLIWARGTGAPLDVDARGFGFVAGAVPAVCSSPRNVRVAAAASPRLISTESRPRRRGGAACRRRFTLRLPVPDALDAARGDLAVAAADADAGAVLGPRDREVRLRACAVLGEARRHELTAALAAGPTDGALAGLICVTAAAPPRPVTTGCPRRRRGAAAIHQRKIRAANVRRGAALREIVRRGRDGEVEALRREEEQHRPASLRAREDRLRVCVREERVGIETRQALRRREQLDLIARSRRWRGGVAPRISRFDVPPGRVTL